MEEGLEKWIVLTHESGERKGNKGRVVHPDMTGKLAFRLILEARRQELNNLACSLRFARGMEQPSLCIHLSLNLLGVYTIDNTCFLLLRHCYLPSFFSCSVNTWENPAQGSSAWCCWVLCFSSYHPDQQPVFVHHRSHCNNLGIGFLFTLKPSSLCFTSDPLDRTRIFLFATLPTITYCFLITKAKLLVVIYQPTTWNIMPIMFLILFIIWVWNPCYWYFSLRHNLVLTFLT